MQYIGIQFNDRNIQVSEVILKSFDWQLSRTIPAHSWKVFFENWLPAQLYNVDR